MLDIECLMNMSLQNLGISLAEAHLHYAPHHRFTSTSDTSEELQGGSEVTQQDIREKLRDGRLGAIGLKSSKSKRQKEAAFEVISDEVSCAPDCRLDFHNNVLTNGKISYHDVRLVTCYEMPSYPASLRGNSLKDCFIKIVEQDWLYREMKEPILTRHPFWRGEYEKRPLEKIGLWHVHFESWPEPAKTLRSIALHLAGADRDPPEPPDEVLSLRERNMNQVRLFISWLRDSKLLAMGIKEPKEDDPSPVSIPASWWSPEDVTVQFATNGLSIRNPAARPKFVLRYSEIRVTEPESEVRNVQTQSDMDESASEFESEFSGSSKPRRPYGNGESEVWTHLNEIMRTDPEYLETTSKAQIARDLGELQNFERYGIASLETYVRRAFKHLDS